MIEISSTDTHEAGWDQWPPGVRTVIKAAENSGWTVRTGFSRGHVPGRKRGTWDTRDMIGVWVNGYGHRAVAWWERNPDADFSAKALEKGVAPGAIPSGLQWKSQSTAIWTGGRAHPDEMAFPYASLADFREYLAVHGAVLPSWFATIQAWVLAHAERDRRKAPAAPRARDHG